jgi:hypothetical protein
LEKLEILDQKELLGPKGYKEKQVVQLDRMDLLEKWVKREILDHKVILDILVTQEILDPKEILDQLE